MLTDDLSPAGHLALPVDLRPANGLVHTLTVPPTGSAELLWELLRGKGVDPDHTYFDRWRADQCHFSTAAGDRIEAWDYTSGLPVPEWVTLRTADHSTLAEISYVGGPERILRVPRRVPSPGRATASLSRESTHPYQRPRSEVEHAATRPFWPSDIARILAQHVEVTPQHLAGPLQQIPLDRLVDFDLPSFDEVSQRGRYTVFEVGERPRSRPSFQAWVLADYIADAVAAARRPPRAAQVLTRPIHGYPIPQVVLTPRDADREHVALVCDWRGRGTGVATILCPPLVVLDDFERLVARDAPWPHAPPVAHEAPVALQDAFERQFIQLLHPANQHEWVVPVVAVADPESTTTTDCNGQIATRAGPNSAGRSTSHFSLGRGGITK